MQRKIVEYIAANPIATRKVISENLNLTADGVKYHLTKLQRKGIIKHVGSTKAGRWEIKRL